MFDVDYDKSDDQLRAFPVDGKEAQSCGYNSNVYIAIH